MNENLRKYVEICQQRIAAAKAADEAREAAAKAERRESNRLAWLEQLQFVYAILPEDLHYAVAYDVETHPTYSVGYDTRTRSVDLNCVPCVPIGIEMDGYGRHPCFVAHRANKIGWFENEPYISYGTGTSYTDPLMAIAEAYSFGPGNADMDADLRAMQSAIEADPDIAERLESVFAQSLADLPAPAGPLPDRHDLDILRTLSQEIATPEPEPVPNKTTELLAEARRLYLEDDNQGAMAAALIAIAELMADDRPIPF